MRTGRSFSLERRSAATIAAQSFHQMCCRRKRRIWHRVPQSGTGADGTRFIFCNFDGVKSRRSACRLRPMQELTIPSTFIVSEDDTTYGTWNDYPAPTAARILTDAPQSRRRCVSGNSRPRRRFTPDGSGANGRAIRTATTDVLPKAGRGARCSSAALSGEAGETALFCVQAEASCGRGHAGTGDRALRSGSLLLLRSPVMSAFSASPRLLRKLCIPCSGESGWLYKLGENAVWAVSPFQRLRPLAAFLPTLERGSAFISESPIRRSAAIRSLFSSRAGKFSINYQVCSTPKTTIGNSFSWLKVKAVVSKYI